MRHTWLHLRDIKNSKTSEEAYDSSVTLATLVTFPSSISLNILSEFWRTYLGFPQVISHSSYIHFPIFCSEGRLALKQQDHEIFMDSTATEEALRSLRAPCPPSKTFSWMPKRSKHVTRSFAVGYDNFKTWFLMPRICW